MHILQLVPSWEDVPPAAYGGIEQVVAELCHALARRGHMVSVSATADSKIGGTHENITVLPGSERSLRRQDLPMDVKEKMAHEHVFDAWRQAQFLNVDVVHNHASEDGMEASFDNTMPILTTVHNLPTRHAVWEEYAGHYATISNRARSVIPAKTKGQYAGTVYNAIDVGTFPFQKNGTRDFLFWIGRFAPVKGPHVAIEVAKRTGLRLVLAGKVDADVPEDEAYFEQEIKPHLDQDRIMYVGEVNDTRKRKLYRKAIATLMPINWEEPFGMVTIESLACGTPVIAFARGALPEVIRDGETGFLVDTVDEMVEAVWRLPDINRINCRQDMQARFDADVMAAEYEAAYRKTITHHMDRVVGSTVPSAPA